MTDLKDVLTYIHSTTERSDLDRIFDACRSRSKLLGTITAASLAKGDRVRIERISPKYLAGVTGTISHIESRGRGKAYAIVEADSPVYGTRHHGTTEITGIPMECLVRVDSTAP